MAKASQWSPEEVQWLEDHWGQLSQGAIAQHLGRSVNGVRVKATRLGLGDPLFCVDGVSLNQLARALHVSYSTVKGWQERYQLPVLRKIVARRMPVWMIHYDAWWVWADMHRHQIRWNRLEPHGLGAEPGWVAAWRPRDYYNSSHRKRRPWSAADDQLLRTLLQQYQYSYPELAQRLHRTESAIKRRCYDLEISARPVRLDNHRPWAEADVILLQDWVRQGYGLNEIGTRLGRSEFGMRQKLDQLARGVSQG